MKFLTMGSNGNSSNEQDACNSHSRNAKKIYHRHNTQQIQTLEAYFKECPHPDDNQRRQLSKDLGLEPRQIKFWFQNKRTQIKTQNERADNSVLRAENERIHCENLAIREALKNNVSKLLYKYTGKEFAEIESLSSSISTPMLPISFTTQETRCLAIHHDLDPKTYGNIHMERALLFEAAGNAMDELIRLLQVNEPLWIKLPSNGTYVIQRDNYERTFSKAIHLRSPSARFESSKDSAVVTMNSIQLINMFLDADKWADIFPTIVTKAKTIQVLETGLVGSRHGSLQLMYAKMHILSPFVAHREFYFLRHCQQIKTGLWVIVDVSYTVIEESTSQCWKLPSGCMIQELPNGCSRGRTSVMKLSHRMVKSFCSILSMSDELDFPQLSEMNNGVRLSIRQSIEIGQQKGVIVSAATSLWLPNPCQNVFSLLTDEKTRVQWDVLCDGNLVNEIANISIGDSPRNRVTILRPFVPSESNMLMLQEMSGNESLGYMLVYAPISTPGINIALNGEDSSNLPILPSGFIVSNDGHCPERGVGAVESTKSSGSLLTIVFQILVSSNPSSSKELNIQSVATVNTLISSTVQRVKALLSCCNNLD
ncbi:hypothetical protein COLO4_06945 [Corchorus olitorius]|uniref:Homeobox domain-containing protein n=1 Tax=Corchorus olitorius TaxID=93759 RepID=A0A1R3KLD6_9ROSI|nr:hypothetical protein COLO4_06945 [Corchorus olitorius]